MKLFIAAGAIAALAFTAAALADGNTLRQICDRAPSPLNETRPAGVAGVAPDKVDPKAHLLN